MLSTSTHPQLHVKEMNFSSQGAQLEAGHHCRDGSQHLGVTEKLLKVKSWLSNYVSTTSSNGQECQAGNFIKVGQKNLINLCQKCDTEHFIKAIGFV